MGTIEVKVIRHKRGLSSLSLILCHEWKIESLTIGLVHEEFQQISVLIYFLFSYVVYLCFSLGFYSKNEHSAALLLHYCSAGTVFGDPASGDAVFFWSV